RLVAHPSLVLWNGNNENLPAYTDWGWQDGLAGRSWGGGYYHELLPKIVDELDPTRPYAPGSPYSPGDLPPNDAHHGTRHDWDVWNFLDYTHYRSWWPRTAGALVWQLNDCWPVTSWSAIDSDERPKPLFYALRHAFAPRLLTVQLRQERPTLIAVNDHDEPWTGVVRVTRQDF